MLNMLAAIALMSGAGTPETPAAEREGEKPGAAERGAAGTLAGHGAERVEGGNAGEPGEALDTADTPIATGAVLDVIRIAEDTVERRGERYRAGRSFTEAALPVGYPRPTAPGAIEIKQYPTVRRAQVSGDGSNGRGGFWPLFQHIQRNDIAMTAPVEMIYDGVTVPDSEASDAGPSHVAPEGTDWTMSFLYRRESDGPTGFDGSVEIIDAEPVIVIATGVRGGLDGRTTRESADELIAWIEESDAWEIAGDLRTFGYNGPAVPNSMKWWEVQVPIRPAATPSESASESEPESQSDREVAGNI